MAASTPNAVARAATDRVTEIAWPEISGTRPPVLPEARLTVYTPADEQTRDQLPVTRRAR